MSDSADRTEDAVLSPLNCTCANLRMAGRAAVQIYDAALAPCGVTTGQFSLLNVVERAGPETISRLAALTVTDRTTLTRTIKPLEREGLLASVRGEDRRRRLVVITDEGRARLEAAKPHWAEAQRRMVDHLGAANWADLIDKLRAVVSAAG